ncbi:DNA-binding transcriptional regulator GbsR (MarR family) [Streptomyces sp. KhCrAH-43]|uniref:GbsR/MarR family transcriptional regulator n=1 Tax=Streptomyces TaxID=1883 RepID=UPI00035C0B6C|nr:MULTISPECIES: MarR family transcriptional regulator [unclassified Streptomyces]MYS34158.1 MarR family transcriptional regulator [Streptomyces sp. SID4920]MYX70063.1 MarR family transcriptional regulator [Streptomyces sp. SID8373]RAJ61126.1 DNA-binding transcriptional regulator GbsR (MarR family) [Streptomyces sp. KhCrAH-43]
MSGESAEESAPKGAARGREGRDAEAVARFVERFASEMTEAGMQRMASRVFAALLADDDASMTSAELALALQISPAAVSGAINYLTQVSMVGREREPGSRRDRYRLHNEIWYTTFAGRDQVLTRWERTLKEGARTLGEHTPAGARIAETAAFFEFLQAELEGLMGRWEEHRKSLDLPTGGPESGA